MNCGPGIRWIVLAAGVAAFGGCGDDDDDDGGGGTTLNFGRKPADNTPPPTESLEFFDDFSGSFPAPNWEIRRGSPFVTPIVGNDEPALALRPFGDRIRVRSGFTFSGSEPLTLTFDLATYELQNSSTFKSRLRSLDGHPETSIEADIDDHEFEFRISGSRDDDDFAFVEDEGASFMQVKFTVDANGAAAWWIDGVSFMTGTFAPGAYKLEFETSGGDHTKFVVDNVRLTRP